MAKQQNNGGVIMAKISQIKTNPQNPRLIKDDKYRKLVQSITDFPQMLEKRPLVCYTDTDGKYVVLGGNMRLKASTEVGLKELPIVLADDWTAEQRQEFLIKDNVGFGEWDWEQLANEWDTDKLEAWGLDIPQFNNVDYSDKNEEIDVDSLDEKMTIKLTFTENDYWKVKEQLSNIAATPEQAVWKLLGNE
jgi:ParB-like chromosome segregation protein Spo0J